MIYTTAHALFHDRETVEESIAHYNSIWPLQDINHFEKAYNDNGGVFLAVVDGERVVGTGALRRIDHETGEIKRLWLLPAYQGQGLGYRMIMALLEAARERGYMRVRLETSPAYQQRAFKFYQRLGFYEIPRYGDDPDDVGMELVL